MTGFWSVALNYTDVLVSVIYDVNICNGLYRPLVRKRGHYNNAGILLKKKKKKVFYFDNLCKDVLFPSLSLL